MAAIQANNQSPATDAVSPDLRGALETVRGDLDRVEQMLVQQVGAFEPSLRGQMRYLLEGTGKRLRPALALLAGSATGGITERHIIIGTVVELIHLATLVHDDVLDEAELRHAQPTANSRWGNHISVLLGDCLFAQALHLTAIHNTSEVCRRVSAATNLVCAGEILQNQRSFDVHLALDQYLDIIDKKTGALFALSSELGAELNAAPPAVVQAYREFGSNLGIAYQIYDDCVDVVGQERKAGKSLGTDVKKGKLTLPFLLLLQHAGPDRRAEFGEIIFRGSSTDRQQLLQLALSNGVVTESLLTIDRYAARAHENLTGLPVNDYTRSLMALLDLIAAKSRALLQEGLAA
jgi:octaprenyl-diphosphate synthase